MGMEHLQNYIQVKYDFTDYQMAQLRFFTVTLLSELSKLLIIGLFFVYDIRLYLWTIVIFQIVRSTTGGIHCRTYAGCLLLSLAFMVIIIKVLPLFTPALFTRILMLVTCAAVSFITGPVTSAKHLKLSSRTQLRLRLKVVAVIALYILIMCMMPDSRYIVTGFWTIVLNTFQLGFAKIIKKEVPTA